MKLRQALAGLLPVVAILSFALGVGATLAVAGDTLGYDFRAYYAAATRVLAGQPAYDPGFDLAGAFGLFFYPPTFLPLALPFALLPEQAATVAWIALMLGCFVGALVAMPVSTRTRFWILLVAGLSWPVVYNIKLGQVGPLLLLLFAVAWRWLDRPWVFGIASALGAAVKVQPGILLVWALLRRRWRAVLAGAVALVVLVLIATVSSGFDAWTDFWGILTRVSDPVRTPQNATPGAVAWQLGVPLQVAGTLQVITAVVVIAVFVAASLLLPTEPSFLVAVITTQLLSPILWDHYAIVLLLPTAWLLDRGRMWALAIPLVTTWLLVGITPPVIYPIVYAAAIACVAWVGVRDDRTAKPALAGAPARPQAAPVRR
jgi:alpha-1,2-mannosyltransferase